MMAPKLRFSNGLKVKATGAVTACVPAATPLVESFTGPSISTEHKKQWWWRWGFFFTFEGLSRVWLLFYERFDAALLLWSSPVLTADSQCFTRDNARTFVPTIPRWRWAFTVSLNIEVFIHSCEQCGHWFFFLTRHPRHQFPLPANLHETATTSVAGPWQMRRIEIEVGRIYTSLATGMVVFATYRYVPWQWTGQGGSGAMRSASCSHAKMAKVSRYKCTGIKIFSCRN